MMNKLFSLMVLVFGVSCVLNAQASLSNGVYTVVNQASGLALADGGSSTSHGLTIGQWPYDGGTDAQWQLIPLSNGNYEIVNQASALALADGGASQARGLTIGQWPYDGGPDAQWHIVSLGGNLYELVNQASGMALADGGASQAHGFTIGQWPYDGGPDAQWQIVLASGGGDGSGSLFAANVSDSTIAARGNFSLGKGATCTDITGTWTENTSPQATWTLTQSGDSVSGTVSANDPVCGNVVWSVSGSLSDPYAGTFTLSSTNPRPSSCQIPPFQSATDTITLNAPGCTAGNGTHSVSSGNYATSWVDPAPAPTPIPTSLSLSLGPLKTYSNETFYDCVNAALGTGYGYARCGTYTLLDQTGKAMLNTNTRYWARETRTMVYANYSANSNIGQGAVDDDGKFFDFLALSSPSHALPSNTKGVRKQVITISDTTANKTYTVRINCLVFTATDVKVNDVTTSGDQTCASF